MASQQTLEAMLKNSMGNLSKEFYRIHALLKELNRFNENGAFTAMVASADFVVTFKINDGFVPEVMEFDTKGLLG